LFCFVLFVSRGNRTARGAAKLQGGAKPTSAGSTAATAVTTSTGSTDELPSATPRTSGTPDLAAGPASSRALSAGKSRPGSSARKRPPLPATEAPKELPTSSPFYNAAAAAKLAPKGKGVNVSMYTLGAKKGMPPVVAAAANGTTGTSVSAAAAATITTSNDRTAVTLPTLHGSDKEGSAGAALPTARKTEQPDNEMSRRLKMQDATVEIYAVLDDLLKFPRGAHAEELFRKSTESLRQRIRHLNIDAQEIANMLDTLKSGRSVREVDLELQVLLQLSGL
jgi:hypothetical protein